MWNPYYVNPAQQQSYNLYLEREFKKKEIKQSSNSIGLFVIAAIFAMQLIAVIPVIIPTIVYMFNNINRINNLTLDINTIIQDNLMVMYFAQGLASLVGFVVSGLIYVKISHSSLNELLTFKKVSGKMNYLIITAGFSVCMIANFIVTLFSNNLRFFSLENSDTLNLTGKTIIEHILFVLVVAVVPAIAEEFVFRGIVLGKLRKYGDGFAVLTSAFVFGLMHGNFTQIPFAFVVGLVIGYMTVKTNSMLPGIILHFVNNGYAVISEILNSIMSEATFEIYNEITCLLIIALGTISFVILILKHKDFFTLKSEKTFEFTIGEKLNYFFNNAGIVICSILFGLSALFTLFAAI